MWDTTLKQLKDKEILFIMAHEMGHYVMKHIYWGVASYVLLSFIGMYLISRIINMCIRKWGDTLQIPKAACFSILPLFFLISSVLSFVSQPATNYVSRIEERAADQYALDMTKDGKSGVKRFNIYQNEFKPSKSSCVSEVFLIHTSTNFRKNSYV